MVASVTAIPDKPPTAAWHPLRYHPQQHRVWTRTAPRVGRRGNPAPLVRFVGLDCGRGSGKTELAKRNLVRWLPVPKPWPTPRYFYGAPTEAQAKRIGWNHLLSLIPGALEVSKGLTPPPGSWVPRGGVKLGELKVETIFGAELYVVGLDKPQRIEGEQWDGGVLDESCDLKPKTFDLTVLPMLTWRDGWCWRIGVPKRQGPSAVEYREWVESSRFGMTADRLSETWPSSDILPEHALRDFQQTMDLKDYLEQFDARWQTAGGGIFFAFDREYNVRDVVYDPRRPLIVGCDFNVDPMAWVVGHASLDPKRMEWFDEIWKRDTNTAAVLDILFQRYKDHKGGVHFYPDASGTARKTSSNTTDIQLIYGHKGFKALGRSVHYRKANPPLTDRFAACNAMFCNAAGDRRMFVDPKCKRLIRDLEARYYKEGTREPADGDARNKGLVGHPSDAMGYPVFALFPVPMKLDEGGSETIYTT